MRKRTQKISVLAMCMMFCIYAWSQQLQHPLDPLNWQEYWKVLEVLRDAGHLDNDTRFSMINLVEPDKATVWGWQSGQPVTRVAFAHVHQGSQTFRAEINLNDASLNSWTEVTGIHPPWLEEEFESLVDEVKKHPEFIEAMRKRGYTDLTFVDCVIWPPGYYGTEEQKGKRIGLCACSDPRGVRNTWNKEIEGLSVLVDMHEGKVIRVIDEGVVPVPAGSADYDDTSIPSVREVPGPLHIEQPLGPGFAIDGHMLEWQNWRFHVKSDHRVGIVISTVSYNDGNGYRPVMYQGSLSEIFVPYMDPAFSWYVRNFIDAGEFTAGGLTKPLLRGMDAPDHAYYLNGLVCNDRGRPAEVIDAVAIFERETGDPSWRHYDPKIGSESRVKKDLVIRAAAVLGNYDYIFDWIFQQDGSIRVRLGATGIAEAKATSQRDAASARGGEPADAYGRFVEPNVVAVNHDHYFCYRIDLDVDGMANNLQLDRLRTKMLPEDHLRRSVWTNQAFHAANEKDAQLNIKLEMPTLWRVLSTERKNHVGYPTSYQLMPVKTASTLLSEDDYPRRRVGFIDHHLWATPFDAEEKYAAGDFPTQSEPGMGLPQWTKQNRSLVDEDIVLWYTMAMHHMVRAEDWPVMPVLWHDFELRPFDFFDRNPALDLPK